MQISQNRIIQNGAVALSAAYFALLPQFYHYTNEETRFNISWNWSDYFAITTAIIILAVIYIFAYLIADRLQRKAERPLAAYAAAWIICYLVLRCIKSIVVRSGQFSGMIQDVLVSEYISAIMYLIFPMAVLFRWRARAVLYIRKLLAALIILPAVFLIQATTWKTYPKTDYSGDVTSADIPLAANVAPASDIIICIFDEWSYDRTFTGEKGGARADMPNLQRFMMGSTVFNNAISSGSETHVSLPRFIFQRDPEYIALSYDELTERVYALNAPHGPSIFFGHTNHFRAVLAFHVPYPLLLKDDVDYSIYIPFLESGVKYLSRVSILLNSQLAVFRRMGFLEQESVNMLRRTGGAFRLNILKDQFNKLIRLSGVNIYVLAHFPCPHKPMIWDKTGLLDSGSERGNNDPLGYEGNLRYTDVLLGELLDEIRRAGRYDAALIIVTSDHGWREDPNLPKFDRKQADADTSSLFRRVPLIVKYPHQEYGAIEGKMTSTLSLYPMIEDALK